MESEAAVFSSAITRGGCEHKNNLYDLLEIVPAKPLYITNTKNETCGFTPNCNKQYIPPKRSKLKVTTVKQIRALFEEDMYSYLPDELEKQQSYLLRKIRSGNLRDENTKKNAKSMLNGNKPISKVVWQMIANINPEEHKFSKQFVLWKGKCIQVNGSRGGKVKFLCNHDLSKKPQGISTAHTHKNTLIKSKLGLLRNSLNVKFKPGPLQKKRFLDNSHHKYNMGQIELIKLPSPALDVFPTYGTILEPTITSLLSSLRGDSDIITPKWAEFSVSVLGNIVQNVPEQLDKKCCVTFALNYKCTQNRLLMRRNAIDTSSTSHNVIVTNNFHSDIICNNESKATVEIKKVMDEILNSVEISLQQDYMYLTDDDFSKISVNDSTEINDNARDKTKRKQFNELDRLDVTVIKLPKNDETKPCGKSFCMLGCVCDSLYCAYNLKQHCGVLDCMFGCKCNLSKYKDMELLGRDCTEMIPGLLKLGNEINSQLSKEEQKFRQTVIVSGENRIILKTKKRNWKPPKKYEDYDTHLQNDKSIKKVLTVIEKKLDCQNIEPWCMVHNLYKCFCKGKITAISFNAAEVNTNKTISKEDTKVETTTTHSTTKLTNETVTHVNFEAKNSFNSRFLHEKKSSDLKNSSDPTDIHVPIMDICSVDKDFHFSCARTTEYKGRKYTKRYYKNTNLKIIEMEENDDLLKKRMLSLMQKANHDSHSSEFKISSESSGVTSNPEQSNESIIKKSSKKELDYPLSFKRISSHVEKANNDCHNSEFDTSSESLDVDSNSEQSNESIIKNISKEDLNNPFAKGSNKCTLKTWLEVSFRKYKARLAKGVVNNCLVQPRQGLSCLQPWDFILSRYRERKNIYFVSKHTPFRTFLAVDPNHSFFANCINIDDIRFADLPKYPLIIQNLLTNATDLENTFCMLRGWNFCWELMGSAVRIVEKTDDEQSELNEVEQSELKVVNTENLSNPDDLSANEDNDCHMRKTLIDQNEAEPSLEKDCKEKDSNNIERSKWFVLKIENDFTEIQFYKKGFYVTYEGIQRSISIARVFGKTVRLSSQVCSDKNCSPQYGIYAIPSTSESCVFIGPYEECEPLGIEVVKTFLDNKKQEETRGVWITTNKVDNMKVIDNPLSFMPSVSMPNDSMVTFEANSKLFDDKNEGDSKYSLFSSPQKELPKTIKPIKISRSNGFYHLSSNKMLQRITNIKTYKPIKINNKTNNISLLNKSDDPNIKTIKEFSPSVAYVKPFTDISPQQATSDESSSHSSMAVLRPIAEIAPQIKITSVYTERSEQTEAQKTKTNKEAGMFILKPEEINKKALGDSFITNVEPTMNKKNENKNMDVEGFIASSTICANPNEIFTISDSEDDFHKDTSLRDIWIECISVENFGYIPGRINDENAVSFEMPGLIYSKFYTENEAFDQINQILKRKMYVPNNITLRWQVKRSQKKLTSNVLTSKCLEDKNYLMDKLREQGEERNNMRNPYVINTRSRSKRIKLGSPSTSASEDLPAAKISKKSKAQRLEDTCSRSDQNETKATPSAIKSKTSELIEDLEETSRKLENEGEFLMKEAVTRRNQFFSSLIVPENLQAEMTGKLEHMLAMND